MKNDGQMHFSPQELRDVEPLAMPICPCCNGLAMFRGVLHGREHFECRVCGTAFTTKDGEEPSLEVRRG